MYKAFSAAAVLAASSLLALPALAQNTNENPTSSPTARPSPGMNDDGMGQDKMRQGRGEDHFLATWLVLDNQGEIELARIAEQKAQNEEVKQFARTMIQQHQQMLSDLQPFASATGAAGTGNRGSMDEGRRGTGTGNDDSRRGDTTGTGTGNDDASRRGTGTGTGDDDTTRRGTGDDDRRVTGVPGTPGTTGTPGTGTGTMAGDDRVRATAGGFPGAHGAFGDVALIRDLKQKCLESSRQALQEKNGAEFDQCYVGMMVMKHQEALDTIQVFQKYSSERLKTQLQSGESVVQEHLDHAKNLMKELDKDRGDQTRRETGR